jgi:hypothetical protein
MAADHFPQARGGAADTDIHQLGERVAFQLA